MKGATSLGATPKIAILIPCFNEATTIASVVESFSAELPAAKIYVYDNNSTDSTAVIARSAGAIVRSATLQGKGNVVRRMFADIEADAYLLVDGDGTYDSAAAPGLIAGVIVDGLDMVCAARVSTAAGAFRAGHQFGNWFLTGLVRGLFGRRFEDMLTGYRAMSRRFVKSFPAHSGGFEIETELTVHALQMRVSASEVKTVYLARPAGSESKLRTVRDGARILAMIGLLVRDERPLQLFSACAGLALILAGLLAAPVARDYMTAGTVPRFPSLIVTVGLTVVALLSLVCGLILDSLAKARLEQRHLAFLAIPGPVGNI